MRVLREELAKFILSRLFGRFGINVITEYQLYKMPTRIDMLAVCTRNQIESLRSQSCFIDFRMHNLLEYKSMRRSFNLEAYYLAISKAYAYMAQCNVEDLKEISIWALCERKPLKLMRKYGHIAEFTPVEGYAGIYRSDDKVPFYVLVMNELEIEERNYVLLNFAGKERLELYVRHLAERGLIEELRHAYLVNPHWVSEVIDVSMIRG
ncbi:MAG TPA: hypothetical protein EYP10_13955, partial [Armatimonadetes bacterium]|nr:hypothetical protein [Armatimonadota bacterium]